MKIETEPTRITIKNYGTTHSTELDAEADLEDMVIAFEKLLGLAGYSFDDLELIFTKKEGKGHGSRYEYDKGNDISIA